ncbi:MAG: YcxB family protein [Tyzzerella sp.]|nr:YcxB family protein [Tyzzerella sp.]
MDTMENKELEIQNEELDRKMSKYVVPVKRDEKMLKTFVKFSNNVRHPRVTGYMVIVGGTLAILPFVNKEIELPGVIICHVMGTLMVLMGIFRHWIGVYMLKSNPQTQLNEELTYLFGNTGVKVEKGANIEHMGSYKKIYRVWEDEKHFYIGMNEDDLAVLPKDHFEVGDVGTFRDFILEKSRAIYTWKPTRVDNVIKQNILNFKVRMTQMRMGANEEEK